MLATSLEPIHHRDYTVAVKHHYPSTPLKHVQDKPTKKKKKKKTKKKIVQKEHSEYLRSLDIDGTLAGAVTPESVIDINKEVLATHDSKDIQERLLKGGQTQRKKQLSVIKQEKTKEFTNVENEYSDVESYANSLAKRIIEESIPKTVQVFDPSELYAQDLASSIMQQAIDNVVDYMDEREQSIQKKTEQTRLDLPKSAGHDDIDGVKPSDKQRKDERPHNAVVKHSGHHKAQKHKCDDSVITTTTAVQETKVDLSVLNKYRK